VPLLWGLEGPLSGGWKGPWEEGLATQKGSFPFPRELGFIPKKTNKAINLAKNFPG